MGLGRGNVIPFDNQPSTTFVLSKATLNTFYHAVITRTCGLKPKIVGYKSYRFAPWLDFYSTVHSFHQLPFMQDVDCLPIAGSIQCVGGSLLTTFKPRLLLSRYRQAFSPPQRQYRTMNTSRGISKTTGRKTSDLGIACFICTMGMPYYLCQKELST